MAVKRYDGSAWQVVAGKGDQGTSSSIATWVKTASGGETSLSGNDDNSQALSYTVGQELVFINGTLLKRGSDYTATNGTSITGLTALAANDVATVWTVNAFSVTGAIANTIVDAKGDILVGTAADTPGRLAVGSNGTILQADSSTGTGLSYVSSRWYTIASGSLSGTEVSLTSLPTGYNTLRLEIYGPQTATSAVDVSIRFNSNANSVYESCAISSLGTSVINAPSSSVLEPMFNQEACPTGSNTYSMFIEIDRYNDVCRKFIKGMWNQTDNVVIGGHNFNSTDAITSIQIRLNGTATFSGGTYVLRGN